MIIFREIGFFACKAFPLGLGCPARFDRANCRPGHPPVRWDLRVIEVAGFSRIFSRRPRSDPLEAPRLPRWLWLVPHGALFSAPDRYSMTARHHPGFHICCEFKLAYFMEFQGP